MKLKPNKILIRRLLLALIMFFFILRLSNIYTRGYWFRTTKGIEKHFVNWSSNVMSNYDSITNDTIIELYDIYDAFYSPRELNRIGDCEWGDSLYLNSKYLLIESQINYCILPKKETFDTLPILDSVGGIPYKLSELFDKDSNRYYETLIYFQTEYSLKNAKTLDNFRPETRYDAATILYADKRRIQELINFLGNNNFILGVNDLSNYSRFFRDKKNFLEPYIKIDVGHWGGWHLVSHPSVYDIVLNHEMDEAHISFRLMYQFGGANLRKINGYWILIESGLGGIE